MPISAVELFNINAPNNRKLYTPVGSLRNREIQRHYPHETVSHNQIIQPQQNGKIHRLFTIVIKSN
jgi:hypothetical protein